ncbi:AaceriAFR070Wp [[Ashbya] aceris (nom. inval.)]|nr:AaceriAFR070Wp [[Ashbya] aceris (nom. inval.)]
MGDTRDTHAPFPYGIKSFDFHTYIPLADPAPALRFRDAVCSEFQDALRSGAANAYEPHMGSIGPHVEAGLGMFEFDVCDADVFVRMLHFFQLNHGPLSVLIHPRTERGDLWDHTEGALWLGAQVALDLGALAD